MRKVMVVKVLLECEGNGSESVARMRKVMVVKVLL